MPTIEVLNVGLMPSLTMSELEAVRLLSEELSKPSPVDPIRRRMAAGRNEPCPCGSGKKFKKCCRGK